MPKFAVYILLAMALWTCAEATTRHVPVNYPTIQSALDVLSENDTVLVDTGLYEEALLAPSINFTLRGNVVPDTGDYPRPIIDPSFLPNPTHLSCLRQDSANLVIEDMWFRNRWPMHPSASDTGGGIFHPHGAVTVRRCMFDSTDYALVAFWSDMTMEHCAFRHLSGYGPFSYQRAEASDCSFQSDTTRWAQFTGRDGSRIERCDFSGSYGNANILNLGGNDVQVRDCKFGPGTAQWMDRIVFVCTNSVFENNVITNLTLWTRLFGLQMLSPGSLVIRSNTVQNCQNPISNNDFRGFDLEQEQTCDTCVVDFDANMITNCQGQIGVSGVVVAGGNNYFHDNRFTALSPLAAENFGATWVLRDNLFYGNAMGLNSSSAQTDARWNWWGDSTGPRCGQNPHGQGDSIFGNVLFDPWYTDTTFFPNATPERNAPLPQDVSLHVYPNPFNPTAVLEFAVKQPGNVSIVVFNIAGQRVKELVHQRYERGQYRITFDAGELPSGIYFARLDVTPLSPPVNGGRWTKTEKLVLMK